MFQNLVKSLEEWLEKKAKATALENNCEICRDTTIPLIKLFYPHDCEDHQDHKDN